MNKKAELVSNFYSSIYLTLISLLQGIALVLLLPEFITYLRTTHNPFSYFTILPFILTLLIVFTIWHHYTFQVLYLKWFPNIIDAILPFVIAITEFFLVSFVTFKTSGGKVDVEGWTKTFAAFLLMTSFAYLGIFRNDVNLFQNIMTKRNALIHNKFNRKIGIILCIYMLIQASFACFIIMFHLENLLWISLVLFLLHIVYTEYYVTTIIKPFFIKAIEDFEEEVKVKEKRRRR